MDEDYTIYTESYWRGVQCIFLESETGSLHLARTYLEGFELHQAIKANRNRFIVASDYFDVEGELELWDFDAGTNYKWSFPASSEPGPMFRWSGPITLSACNKYAALCGIRGAGHPSVFLIDLDGPRLIQMQSVFWGRGSLKMQFINHLDEFGFWSGDYRRTFFHRYDLKSGRVAVLDADAKLALKPVQPDWDAPSSSEASKMANTMPTPLRTHVLPHERRILRVSPDTQPKEGGHFALVESISV